MRACAAIILLGGLGHGTDTTAKEPDGRPNVLVVVADDLGYSDLGCYGGEIETPNLNRLAAGGLRFTQFYNTGRCWPTRASLLTGFYPHSVRRDTVPGVPSGNRGQRPSWAPLICQPLQNAGYRTYHSGKWHLDGMPIATGFDRSYYLKDQQRFFSPTQHWLDDQPLPAVKRDSGYYGTTAIADHAVKCLTEHAREHSDQPFFHYLAFTAPHFPLQALPADIDRYRERYQVGWEQIRAQRFERLQSMGLVTTPLSQVMRNVGPPYDFPDAMEALGPLEVNRPLRWNELTSEQQQFQATKMAIHAAMIDCLDREFGRVLEQLQSMNAIDNTLILFLSDNGASAEIMVRGDGHDGDAPLGSASTHLCLGPGWSTTSNTPFRYHKTWVHEGGTATPLIAHWPAGIKAAGELRRSVGHVIDLWPTILAVTGVTIPRAGGDPVRPGYSLVPAFANDMSRTRSLWWEHEGNRALRNGDWKISAAGSEGDWELYRLGQDRAETNDLAAEHPDMLRKLSAQWTQLRDQHYRSATQADRE